MPLPVTTKTAFACDTISQIIDLSGYSQADKCPVFLAVSRFPTNQLFVEN